MTFDPSLLAVAAVVAVGIVVYSVACIVAIRSGQTSRALWTAGLVAIFFLEGWSVWGLVLGWQSGPRHIELVAWIGAPLIGGPVLSFAGETWRRWRLERDLQSRLAGVEPVQGSPSGIVRHTWTRWRLTRQLQRSLTPDERQVYERRDR